MGRGNERASQFLDEQADSLSLRLRAPWPGYPKIWSALRIKHYEDTVTQADWDRSGGKAVPLVRLLAVKEAPAAKK